MLEKQERAVVGSGRPHLKAASKPFLFVFAHNLVFDLLPRDPERRIREHIVEGPAREPSSVEGIPVDVLRLLALDEHVRVTDGMGLGDSLCPNVEGSHRC